MITVVAGVKGGGGKTTLATNLTVMRSSEGKKVLLVDSDEQHTATDWVEQRNALGTETLWASIRLEGRLMHTELLKLAKDYDDVIVDVGGRGTTSQLAALSVAHVCLVPFKPKSFDMWTLGQMRTIISRIKINNPQLKVYAVINQADSRGGDNDDAMEVIREFEEFICLDLSIGNRKAFANAAADGLGVIELKKPDPKAVEEIRNLYSVIYQTV